MSFIRAKEVNKRKLPISSLPNILVSLAGNLCTVRRERERKKRENSISISLIAISLNEDSFIYSSNSICSASSSSFIHGDP